jgi:hypothetical protein
MESRGNVSGTEINLNGDTDTKAVAPGNTKGKATGPLGNDWFGSTLHWGPSLLGNEEALTHASWQQDDLSSSFHVYGLYWSEDKFYTYIKDTPTSPEKKVLEIPWWGKESFWKQTGKPDSEDPWPSRDIRAPFSNSMFIILNNAIGGYQFGTDGSKVPAYWEGFPDYLPIIAGDTGGGENFSDQFTNKTAGSWADPSIPDSWTKGTTTGWDSKGAFSPNTTMKVKNVAVYAFPESTFTYGNSSNTSKDFC